MRKNRAQTIEIAGTVPNWHGGRSRKAEGIVSKRIGLFALAALALATGARAETFTLHVTPATVAWGNYSAAAKPVLRIHSGDTIVFDTVLTNSPTGLAKNGVPDDQIQQSLKDVFDKVPLTDRGPGGHILT